MRNSHGKKVTLQQIADEAGLSLPVVSKVLNARQGVSEQARSRTLKALEALEVDQADKPRKRTGLVDIHVPRLDGAWYAEVLRGAAEAAERHGVDLALSTSNSPQQLHHFVRRAIRRGTDGIITVESAPSEADRSLCADSRVPLVVIDPTERPAPDVYSVGSTNFRGAFDAVSVLLAAGHRRIAIIAGLPAQENAVARLAGARAALSQAGVDFSDEVVVHAGYDAAAGARAMRKILELPTPPTAVFSSSDDAAIGAIHELRAAGYRVPETMSVVGFDDLPAAAWTDPPLTTVRQPSSQLGGIALEAVMSLASGRPVADHTELATEIIQRDSVAAPRSTS